MNNTKYFGTDGIRGTVGEFPITPDFLVKLGWAIGNFLKDSKNKKVLIGKDTRISGYMMESALEAGLSSAGAYIMLAGPIPTPAVAYLTRALRANIGIVISASHNPYYDNGVKFFSHEGCKISDETMEAIEYWLSQPIQTLASEKLGKARRIGDAYGRYIEFCKSSVPHNTSLQDLKIVIDCANGSTYHVAPQVFSELGANVIPLSIHPDGTNINAECGSEFPLTLQKTVLETKADLGIAFDGDGDRVIMIDDKGEILDGDELLYIIAKNLLETKRLVGGVVGTQMTNAGLELALNEMGMHLTRVPVGDNHIIAELNHKNWVLGGEPSGHIIHLGATTTADGIITALQVLQAMVSNNKSLHELKQGIKKFPRCVINVPNHDKEVDLDSPLISEQIKKTEIELGKQGRVVLRKSGTEPVIRIMVEGENEALVKKLAANLADVIR